MEHSLKHGKLPDNYKRYFDLCEELLYHKNMYNDILRNTGKRDEKLMKLINEKYEESEKLKKEIDDNSIYEVKNM